MVDFSKLANFLRGNPPQKNPRRNALGGQKVQKTGQEIWVIYSKFKTKFHFGRIFSPKSS